MNTNINYQCYFSPNIDKLLKKDIINKVNNLINNKSINFQNKFNDLNQNVNLVFTFGGDGTLIEAIHKLGIKNIYIPINMGTLGFYTSWSLSNFESIFAENTKLDYIETPLLEITLIKKEETQKFFCLNESTIINPVRTQILDININNYNFEHFRGTGICISTPTGSTAYNKSLNGAIYSSDKNLFQLVKMAPINNKNYRSINNPLIFDSTDCLTLTSPIDNFNNSILTIDRNSIELDNTISLTYNLAKEKAKIITTNDLHFFKRVKNSFLQ